MKNFQLIGQGLDTAPILNALHRQPDLWNANRFRTTFPNTPHVDVDDILIRYSDTEKCDTTSKVIGDLKPIWHPAFFRLPQLRPILLGLMTRMGGYELGRVLISRIKPGGRVLPHADSDGEYVHAGDIARYHVALQGLPGSLYRTGDETVTMLTGQTWWFDALVEHECFNNSADDRIHLLIDMKLL